MKGLNFLVLLVFVFIILATFIVLACKFFRRRRMRHYGLSPGIHKMGLPNEKQFNDANIFKIDDDDTHVTYEENNV